MQKSDEKQEFKGGMLLYPQEYFIDDSNPDLSYCYGQNEYGKPVVFYLNPTEQARESARKSNTGQTVPDFEEFADTGRRATKPCIADQNNSPKTPCGILMMEQVSEKGDGPHPHGESYPGVSVYEAKWASILREADDMEIPPIGFGYMEIGFHPKVNGEVDNLRLEYNQVEQRLANGQISEVDAEEQKEKLYVQITQQRQKWFIAVVLKHKQQVTLNHVSKEDFKNFLAPYLNHYTRDGMYGGAMIRVRRHDVVDSDLSCYCNMSYDYKNGCVQNIDFIFENWMKYNGGRIVSASRKDSSISVDIIPTQRINFGKMSVDKYSKDLGQMGSKIMKTYVDKSAHHNPNVNFFKDKVFLMSKIGVRLAKVKKGASKGGNLASTIHSFSPPMGNIFQVNKEGKMAYKMDFAKERQEKEAQSH